MDKPYTRVPPPLKYHFLDYRKLISSEPDSICGEDGKPSNYALRPIPDLGVAARDEGWLDIYNRLYSFQEFEAKKMLAGRWSGHIKSKDFGPEMTDAEFRKWCGIYPEGESDV